MSGMQDLALLLAKMFPEKDIQLRQAYRDNALRAGGFSSFEEFDKAYEALPSGPATWESINEIEAFIDRFKDDSWYETRITIEKPKDMDEPDYRMIIGVINISLLYAHISAKTTLEFAGMIQAIKLSLIAKFLGGDSP